MKKILSGAVAAIALVGVVSPAAAQTAQLHYAGGVVSPLTNPSGIGGAFAAGLNEGALLFGVGTRYTAIANAPGDTDTADTEITTTFQLSGTVNKDCSFYAGNTSSAQDIDFGVIGVRTGNNENVNSAFEMVGPAVANVRTLTAGCNFNNEVEITKSSALGLINNSGSGYDTDEFQANIPYSVEAKWQGVAQGTPTGGSLQTLTVGTTGSPTGTLAQGAWRSDMRIKFEAPAITGKGLVAGDYTGTTTLTLRAI